jgi:hypothetical protein
MVHMLIARIAMSNSCDMQIRWGMKVNVLNEQSRSPHTSNPLDKKGACDSAGIAVRFVIIPRFKTRLAVPKEPRK